METWRSRWHETGLMPGAGRLVEHLKAHKVPLAVATSSLRGSFEHKMSGPNTAYMRPHFQVTLSEHLHCWDAKEH